MAGTRTRISGGAGAFTKSPSWEAIIGYLKGALHSCVFSVLSKVSNSDSTHSSQLESISDLNQI